MSIFRYTRNVARNFTASLVVFVCTALVATAAIEPLTITTWNIEHLGSPGRGFGGGFGGFGPGALPERNVPLPMRSDEDLKDIAALIQSELGSDVIALQEVGITRIRRGRSVSDPMEKIVAYLNEGSDTWAYFLPQIDELPVEDDDNKAFLGYLWNRSRVRLLTVFEMSLMNQGLAGKALFERMPLIGYFETIRANGDSGNDFALVNVHLASGQGNDENHLIAMTLIEFDLVRNLAKHAVSESDIIILGDFNDDPRRTKANGTPMYSPAMHEHMRFKGYVNLVTPELKASRMNIHMDSLIDHILVNKYAQRYLLADSATIYKPRGAKSSSATLLGAWRETYSDHFPLSFKFTVRSDSDADFFK
jgi:endonuclease/exonuclease/phosphatase family metal-dependent hydrolase